MLEADKADDIEISKSTVIERSKKSKDLEWEIKRAKVDRRFSKMITINSLPVFSILFQKIVRVEIDEKKI